MTETVYQFRTSCHDNVTDQVVYHYTWDTTAPTSCPVSNPDHTFLSTVIVSTITSASTDVKEDTSGTNGYYRCDGLTYNIAAGPDSNPQLIGTSSYPYNIRVYTITVLPSADNIGDIIDFKLTDIAIGSVTSDTSSGVVLPVNSTVIQNMKPGFEVVVVTPSNVTYDLGECASVDTDNSTITVTQTITSLINSGSTVNMGVYKAKNLKITTEYPYCLGGHVLGSTLIPVTAQGQTLYINNSNTAKTISFNVEFSY